MYFIGVHTINTFFIITMYDMLMNRQYSYSNTNIITWLHSDVSWNTLLNKTIVATSKWCYLSWTFKFPWPMSKKLSTLFFSHPQNHWPIRAHILVKKGGNWVAISICAFLLYERSWYARFTCINIHGNASLIFPQTTHTSCVVFITKLHKVCALE